MAERIWSVTDRFGSFNNVIREKEFRLLRRIHEALPTPSNALHWVHGIMVSAAFKVSETCPVCDCWPCRCHTSKEEDYTA